MKKVWIVMLAAVFTFAFLGCGKAKPTLVGKWSTKLNMGEAMKAGFEESEEMAEVFRDVDWNFDFPITMELTEDGKVLYGMDDNEINNAVNELVGRLAPALEQYFEKLAEENGISVDDLKKALEVESFGEILTKSMDAIDFSKLFKDLLKDSQEVYKTEGNKIFFFADEGGKAGAEKSSAAFSLSENTLTLTELTGEMGEMKAQYGIEELVFTK